MRDYDKATAKTATISHDGMSWVHFPRPSASRRCFGKSLLYAANAVLYLHSYMPYLIKICGNKYHEESRAVAQYEPDLMGWIFSPQSPRQVALQEAMSQIYDIKEEYPVIKHVAVFAQNSMEEIMSFIEINKAEKLFAYLQVAAEAAFVQRLSCLLADSGEHEIALLPALRVKSALSIEELYAYGRHALYVLDSYVPGKAGGTAMRLPLEYISSIHLPYLLAGGLHAQNVQEALQNCAASGVDVSSGLETGVPGRKDAKKLAAFFHAVRAMPSFTGRQSKR